jgi:hypothetical protein
MGRNDNWRDQVPSGWLALYDQLLTGLEAIDPDLTVDQAKEKFGELRVYLTTYAPQIDELIDAASAASRRTCQSCGQPGDLMATKDGLYATVCGVHAKERGFRPVRRDPIIASIRVDGANVTLVDRSKIPNEEK